jgi:hypothetical protein
MLLGPPGPSDGQGCTEGHLWESRPVTLLKFPLVLLPCRRMLKSSLSRSCYACRAVHLSQSLRLVLLLTVSLILFVIIICLFNYHLRRCYCELRVSHCHTHGALSLFLRFSWHHLQARLFLLIPSSAANKILGGGVRCSTAQLSPLSPLLALSLLFSPSRCSPCHAHSRQDDTPPPHQAHTRRESRIY